MRKGIPLGEVEGGLVEAGLVRVAEGKNGVCSQRRVRRKE